MMPLSPTANPGTGQLASCVTWDGPDIPCIHLCRGDTITTVVYELGKKLCESSTGLVNFSLLDLACLVPAGSMSPASVTDLLQLLITKFCLLETAQREAAGPGSDKAATSGLVRLPECLQREDADGDLVASLSIADYVQRLAEHMCTVLDEMNQQVLAHQQLVRRLSAVERALNQRNPTGAELTRLLETQCPGIGLSSQRANPANTMQQLPGWVAQPASLTELLTNLWLTVCDARSVPAPFSAPVPVQP